MYAVPFVKPVKLQEVAGAFTVHVKFPGDDVTVYRKTAEPPLLAGARKETDADASPIAAVTPVGAFGTVDGVSADDGSDAAEVPMPFVATTLKVYAVPFVKPVTVHASAMTVDVQVPATLFPDVYAVAVYPVSADPRVSLGASHVTATDPFPAIATTFLGTDGAALIATLDEAEDADDVPAALVAVTWKV